MRMVFSYPNLVVQTQNVTCHLLNKIQEWRGKDLILKTQKIYPEFFKGMYCQFPGCFESHLCKRGE